MAVALRRTFSCFGSVVRKQFIGQRNLHQSTILTYKHSHHAKRNMNRKVGILGLPFNRGQPRRGVRESPELLRNAGLKSRLEEVGCEVIDYEDMEFDVLPDSQDPPMFHIKHPKTNGMMARQVSKKVQQIVENGEVPLSLGGDHSVAIGTIHGHLQARPDAVLYWVDAHADMNPPLASTSGNIHGMSLAFLIYELQQYMIRLKGFDWCKPCLTSNDIVFLGLRDIDPAERYLLDQLNIKHYTPDDIDMHGLDYIMEHTMDLVNPGLQRPIHLSFDVDGLDPTVMPSTGTPVQGGLTQDEGKYICEELGLTGKLSAIDLVEVNSSIGGEEKAERTVNNSVDILASCFALESRPAEKIPSFPAVINKNEH